MHRILPLYFPLRKNMSELHDQFKYHISLIMLFDVMNCMIMSRVTWIWVLIIGYKIFISLLWPWTLILSAMRKGGNWIKSDIFNYNMMVSFVEIIWKMPAGWKERESFDPAAQARLVLCQVTLLVTLIVLRCSLILP